MFNKQYLLVMSFFHSDEQFLQLQTLFLVLLDEQASGVLSLYELFILYFHFGYFHLQLYFLLNTGSDQFI